MTRRRGSAFSSSAPGRTDAVTDRFGDLKRFLFPRMSRTVPTPRRRSETDRFRIAVLRLRAEKKWTQGQLGAKLGVSKRTLSHWECGHWLPPFKQRVHLVLSLHELPPEHVLEIADGLGVSLHPAVEPLLKPYRDALYGESEDESPPPVAAPPPEPPPPRPSPEQVRAALDAVVRDAADGMNVLANDLRATIDRALAASEALGGTLADTREALVVRTAKAKRATP
jgi:transcriptional regulator with XRE-family HTH domain